MMETFLEILKKRTMNITEVSEPKSPGSIQGRPEYKSVVAYYSDTGGLQKTMTNLSVWPVPGRNSRILLSGTQQSTAHGWIS
jgi:hypothetical protein